MPRASTRKSGAQGDDGVHKRALDEPAGAMSLPKRPKRASATGLKSRYFESADAEESTEAASDGSGYEDDAAHPGSSEDLEQSELSEDDGSSGMTRGKGAKASQTSAKRALRAKELSMPGVKTGLGPGTQVRLKKPKARDPGDTPYADDTIHPNTGLFLRELKENNRREWLKANDLDYRAALKDWTTFCESLTERISEVDETIPELPAKDVIFRIYRDIRFSNNPLPYKTAFSAAWSRTGRKGPYAAYYVEFRPGNSLVAGGLWMPEASALAALRRDVDRRPNRLKTILREPRFRKEFLKGAPKDDKKIVKTFADANSENALKTKPMGYQNDHPDVELLRLRSYTVVRHITDAEFNQDRLTELIGILLPFITYLNSVVMPDDEDDEQEPGSSDADE